MYGCSVYRPGYRTGITPYTVYGYPRGIGILQPTVLLYDIIMYDSSLLQSRRHDSVYRFYRMLK